MRTNFIDLKLILGLAIIAAGTLVGYYVNALWLNNITLAVVVALAAVLNFELLNSIYTVAIKSSLRNKNMKVRANKTKVTKLIFEQVIAHLIFFIIASLGIARMLIVGFDDLSNGMIIIVKLLCPSMLDWGFVTRKAFLLLILALCTISITVIAIVLYKSCAKKIYIRNAHYIERLLTSNNSGEPACNREELAKRIYGDKRKNSNIPKKINSLIGESISPIKEFLIKDNNDNILMINAKWGAGKTTCLLIAINETNQEGNRYIYESAFKYRVNRGELFGDVLTALRETLLELGIKANNPIASIIRNLDKDINNTLLNVLKKRNEVDALSSDAIYRINEKYRKRKITNKIFIMIDDLDRLKGEDIVKVLSFLSILRRLEFVKIIIPADRAVVCGALKTDGIMEPQLFVEKYLPSQKEVRIKSNFEMAYSVIEKMIRGKKGNKGKNVRPAIEAVFLKMLSSEMKRQTFGFKNYRHQWLQAGAKGAEEKIDLANEQIRQILSIPTIIEARNKGDAEKYRWSVEYNNIRETQNIVYGLQEKVGSLERPTIISKWRLFSDNDYNYAVKSWIMNYMEKRWDLFGFTIREARNTLSGINFEQLPEDELEQFIFIYNQYNPTRKINIDSDSKKPLIEVRVVDGRQKTSKR